MQKTYRKGKTTGLVRVWHFFYVYRNRCLISNLQFKGPKGELNEILNIFCKFVFLKLSFSICFALFLLLLLNLPAWVCVDDFDSGNWFLGFVCSPIVLRRLPFFHPHLLHTHSLWVSTLLSKVSVGVCVCEMPTHSRQMDKIELSTLFFFIFESMRVQWISFSLFSRTSTHTHTHTHTNFEMLDLIDWPYIYAYTNASCSCQDHLFLCSFSCQMIYHCRLLMMMMMVVMLG